MDFAGLIKTDRRIAQRRETGAVQQAFLPASTLLVKIDDVAVSIMAAEEVLETATPEHTGSLFTQKIGEIIMVQIELIKRRHRCSATASCSRSRQTSYRPVKPSRPDMSLRSAIYIAAHSPS